MRRGRATLAPAGLLVAAVAAAAFVGLGAATVTTDSANPTSIGNDSLVNQTIDVTNGTRSLYVELDNDIATASEPVEVAAFEVDVDGNETEVDRVQISAAGGTTEFYELDALDPANVSTCRVEVLGTASAIDPSALDVGMAVAVSSGGGFLDGSPGGIGVGTTAVVGIGGYLALKEDWPLMLRLTSTYAVAGLSVAVAYLAGVHDDYHTIVVVATVAVLFIVL